MNYKGTLRRLPFNSKTSIEPARVAYEDCILLTTARKRGRMHVRVSIQFIPSSFFFQFHDLMKSLSNRRRRQHQFKVRSNERSDLLLPQRWTCLQNDTGRRAKMWEVMWPSHVTMAALPSWSPRSPSKPSSGGGKDGTLGHPVRAGHIGAQHSRS